MTIAYITVERFSELEQRVDALHAHIERLCFRSNIPLVRGLPVTQSPKNQSPGDGVTVGGGSLSVGGEEVAVQTEKTAMYAAGFRDAAVKVNAEIAALKEQLEEAYRHLEDGDKRETRTRNALKAAGIPDSEAYPDENVDAWEKSLRAGGRMVHAFAGVERLAYERDQLKAKLDTLLNDTANALGCAADNEAVLHKARDLRADLARVMAERDVIVRKGATGERPPKTRRSH